MSPSVSDLCVFFMLVGFESLGYASADRTTIVRKADSAAFQKVADRSGGLIQVPAESRNCGDEVSEGQGWTGVLEGLFHCLVRLDVCWFFVINHSLAVLMPSGSSSRFHVAAIDAAGA